MVAVKRAGNNLGCGQESMYFRLILKLKIGNRNYRVTTKILTDFK
jgi:hypothetical protein